MHSYPCSLLFQLCPSPFKSNKSINCICSRHVAIFAKIVFNLASGCDTFRMSLINGKEAKDS